MSGDATQGEREGFAEEFNGGGQLEMYDVDEYGNYAYYTSDCADNIFSSPQKLQQVCQYLWQAGMLIDKQGEAIPAGDCTLETFIENFRPEWAEKIAGEFHPERGCLIECNSGQNQENLRYDFLMRNTDTYEQAHARGLLNPLGLLGSSNNLPAAVRSGMDPFFLFEGKGAVMKAQMILNFTTRSFTNPADPTQTFTGNLLEQAAMMVMCSRQEPVSQDIIQSTYNFRHFDQSSPNPCTRDRIWEFFRALYLSEKGKLQAGMENGSCRPEIAQGKARRFPDPFDQFTDVEKQLMESDLKSEEDIAGFVEDAGRLLEEACLQRAQSYADNCLRQLEGCLELSTVGNSCAVWDNTCGQYNRLKNAFVFIINSGCNKDNVTGGSNVPADKLSSLNPELDQYPDFHHAMRAILTSGSDGDFTLACNPNLITFPKVLGHSYPSLTSHKKIDECACEQILRSDKEYRMLVQAGRYPKNDITSAQKYFERTYGTGVDNYRAKVCLCEEAAAGEWTANFSINESGRAKLAASDEFVPLAMTCQTCVDCLQMQQAINEFNAQAWIFKLLSLGRPLTTLENYSRQSLLTTFLNGRFDMDKISWDYEEFQKKCGIIETTDVYCELTPQARELETLLNTVTLNGGLTSRNCEPAVSRGISRWGTVTHILENNCAACDQYIYEPQVNNGVLAMHLPGQGCNNLDHCPVTLSLSQADAQAGYRLERVLAPLENLRAGSPEPVNGRWEFHVDASVYHQGRIVQRTLTGSACFPIGQCYQTPDDRAGLVICPREEIPGDECRERKQKIAAAVFKDLYNTYLDSIISSFRENYIEKCMASTSCESFDLAFGDSEHHFTLYYYDQAGNLVRTVPPAGVSLLENPVIDRSSAGREQTVFTGHRLETRYQYNSLNQLVYQYMPDHDAFEEITLNGTASGLPAPLDVVSTRFSSSQDGVLLGTDPQHPEQTRVYTTTDGGNSWQPAQDIGLSQLNDICVLSGSNTVYIAGRDGTLLKTVNGGENWSRLSTGTRENLIGVYMRSESDGLLFTPNGILKYNPGSARWEQHKTLNAGEELEKVYFRDAATGFAVGREGDRALVYFTTDGGTTWEKLQAGDVHAAYPFARTQLVNDQAGYALDRDGLLLATGDGGNTWRIVNTDTRMARIHFWDAANGTGLSAAGKIMHTGNGGITWNLPAPMSGPLGICPGRG